MNRISPGQCHTIGGQISDRLFASSGCFERSQEVSDKRDHPFWAEFDKMIVTHFSAPMQKIQVKVDRSRNGRQVLEATTKKRSLVALNWAAIDSMSHGEGDLIDVYFFTLGHRIHWEKLQRQYDLRGLKSADPFALVAVNELNPSFAKTSPNSVSWIGAHGRPCFASFYATVSEDYVEVDHHATGWFKDTTWFAGVKA